MDASYFPHEQPLDEVFGREVRELKMKIVYSRPQLKGRKMIGDKAADVDAGKNAGCKHNILVLTGKGVAEQEKTSPDYIAKDLLDAVQFGID